MTDLVVTVPRDLWSEWIEEGDAVGSPETGEEWGFFLGHSRPPIEPGDRLYIVAHDRLRGYAPVTRVAFFVDACPDHERYVEPTIERIRALHDEAQEHCDGALAMICADALDPSLPAEARVAAISALASCLEPDPDPTCLWCQLWRVEGCSVQPHVGSRLLSGRWAIGRKGGAVAVTIPEHVRGFRGWRKRWWDRGLERPFPGWIETDLWLSRKRAAAKREAAKVSSTATSSPTTQGDLFK